MPWNSTDQFIVFPLTTVEEASCSTAFEFIVGGEWNLFHVQATIFSRCERLYSKKFCKYFKIVLCYISSSIFNSCETYLEAGSWHFDTLINMVSWTADGRTILKARDLMFRMNLPHYWLMTQFSHFCTEYWWCVNFMKYRHAHSYSVLTYSVSNEVFSKPNKKYENTNFF